MNPMCFGCENCKRDEDGIIYCLCDEDSNVKCPMESGGNEDE